MCVQNLGGRAGKGQTARHTAIEYGTQRIHIGTTVNLAAASTLFGRHIGRRADRTASHRQLRRIEGACDTEVGK